MTDAAKIANAYISAWNETDPARRRAMISEGWTEDASYVDPLMSGKGREQIDGLICAVQDRFPGFRFALVGQADGHAEHVRFSWSLGPKGDEDMIKGTDFAVVEGGRLKSVTGFLDKVPATA
jgi:hypothetical protein